jgi:hypothetical protein
VCIYFTRKTFPNLPYPNLEIILKFYLLFRGVCILGYKLGAFVLIFINLLLTKSGTDLLDVRFSADCVVQDVYFKLLLFILII